MLEVKHSLKRVISVDFLTIELKVMTPEVTSTVLLDVNLGQWMIVRHAIDWSKDNFATAKDLEFIYPRRDVAAVGYGRNYNCLEDP